MDAQTHTADDSISSGLARFTRAYADGAIPTLNLPAGMSSLPIGRIPLVTANDPYQQVLISDYQMQMEAWQLKRMAERVGRERATQLAIAEEREFLGYLSAAAGWPTMAGLGTHKDSAVTEESKQLIEQISNYAVHAGIGLTHGHLYLGNMRWFREYWLRARSRYSPGRVFVGGVPLWVEGPDMDWEHREPPAHWFRYGLDSAVSRPHATLETRFPAIVGASENLASVYAAGGRGMSEELSRDLLSRQHARKSITVYSRRPENCFPLYVLLDFKVNGSHWYWNPTIDRHAIDLKLKTISTEDCRDIIVVRVGEEEPCPYGEDGYPLEVRYFPNAVSAGCFVVERTLQKYADLIAGYKARLDGALGITS